MNQRKQFILHIGDSKTGTSALQWFLLSNRDELARHGYSYHEHAIGNNDISSGNAVELAVNLRDAHFEQAREAADGLWNQPGGQVILSSEHLGILSDDHVERLADYFPGARIVVYLRRQDSAVLSRYNQTVKRHDQRVPFEVWASRGLHNTNRYDLLAYISLLSRWSRPFGKDNLIVRPYERTQFYGGTIFSDFLHFVLGLELTPHFRLPQDPINRSYSNDALEFKRLANHLDFDKDLLDHLLQAYSDECRREVRSTLMSPGLQRQIMEVFSASNARIAREYLGREDGRLFYDSFMDPGDSWTTYPGLSQDEIRAITLYLSQNDCALAAGLAESIRRGLESDDPAVREAAHLLSGGLEPLCAASCLPVQGVSAKDAGEEPRRGLIHNAMRCLYRCLPSRVRDSETVRQLKRRLNNQ